MTDIAEQFAAIRAMLDALEQNGDTPTVRQTLTDVGSALAARWEPPPRKSKKPPRGIGYDEEEAEIVQSIAVHGSLPAAIRARYPNSKPEWHHSVEKRIRRHAAEIKAAGLHDAVALAKDI